MNNLRERQSLEESDSLCIRAELDRLLSDRRFSGARQMSAFLRYIVTETLNGNADRIKAYTIGVDALGKPDHFDAQSDPSVRVLALRLRKTLIAAYADHPDCHSRIVLRVGCYVPVFFKRQACASAGHTEDPSDQERDDGTGPESRARLHSHTTLLRSANGTHWRLPVETLTIRLGSGSMQQLRGRNSNATAYAAPRRWKPWSLLAPAALLSMIWLAAIPLAAPDAVCLQCLKQ